MEAIAKAALNAEYAAPCLRPKSEVWIQHELDLAILNAEKNRSIQVSEVDRATKKRSTKTKSVLKSSSDAQRTGAMLPQKTNPVSLNVSQRPSYEESSTNNQDLLHISGPGFVEEQSTGINTLQTQIQSFISEWSCALKQAMFQEEIGSDNARHAAQLLVIV